MSAHDDLVSELVRLRRGWGLQSRTLRRRIGPQLTRLCAIAESDSSRRIQEKIRPWLQEACTELPPELARAILVAFALDRAHLHSTLTERVEALAAEQNWGPRTARRRIDHATRSVAHAALERSAPGDPADAEWPSTVAGVVRLDAARRDTAVTDAVVVRVPVPSDRFDLLIRFEAS